MGPYRFARSARQSDTKRIWAEEASPSGTAKRSRFPSRVASNGPRGGGFPPKIGRGAPRRSPPSCGVDVDREEPAVGRLLVEDRLVAEPDSGVGARRRHLPLLAERRIRHDVDLAASGFVRDVQEPLPVPRDRTVLELVRIRGEEKPRLRLGLQREVPEVDASALVVLNPQQHALSIRRPGERPDVGLLGKDQLRLRAPVGRFDADPGARVTVRDRFSIRGPCREVRALYAEREPGSDPALEIVEANLGASVLVAHHGRHDTAAFGRKGDGEKVRRFPHAAERLAVEVEPGQAASSERLVALVHEPSRVGQCELADPAECFEGDSFRDRNRRARRFQGLPVERLCEQVAFAQEDEVPRLDEAPLAPLLRHQRGLAGREVERLDRCVLVDVRGLRAIQIEQVLAIRQKPGKAICPALAFHLCNRHRGAARGRHLEQASERRRCKHDDVVDAPRGTASVRCVADRLNGPARGRDALELARREEPDRAAVGRPERAHGLVGSGQRLHGETVHPANPELALPVGSRRGENERRAVG